MHNIVETALVAMSSIKKPQRRFILGLLTVLTVFQGRANFRNMSRYSGMSEKRFSRWYGQPFDFKRFNSHLLEQNLPSDTSFIAAIDASFITKSGRHTEGLGRFYNGCAGKAEQGLEVSLVSVVDLKSHTAFSLDARQTFDIKDQSRIDLYAQQVTELKDVLLQHGVRYLACDAFYTKKNFIFPVTEAGFDIVGKLRSDADLKWLYEGEYKGRGRPREFQGKVNFDEDLQQFDAHGELKSGESIYAKVVYSKLLKRNIQLVMLRWCRGKKVGRALLFSTDTELSPQTLIRYYKARFQIEFVFRDAKQHLGLTQCQARSRKKIEMHMNASLACLNVLKIEDRLQKNHSEASVISIASWKRRKFNESFMKRLFDELGISLTCQKATKIFNRYSGYGAIAA